MLRGALFFLWALFLGRPRWSEGPRLSGCAFLVGFRRFRDFCVGFGSLRRNFGPRGPSARRGPKNPRGCPFRHPCALAYVPERKQRGGPRLSTSSSVVICFASVWNLADLPKPYWQKI